MMFKKTNFSDVELRILLDIASTKSLRQTAENLSIAQPNISRSLSQMEDKIGLEIFDRSSRPLKLTRFGEELLPYIKKNLESHDELLRFSVNYKQASNGFVRLHAPTGQLLFIAKYVVPILKIQHPEIKLTLMTSNLGTSEFTLGVEFSNGCDILFTHSKPQNEELVAREIGAISANVYGTKELIEKHPINDLHDYSHCPCILFCSHMEENKNKWHFMNKQSEDIVSISINGNLACDNSKVAIELAKSGLGYIYMPDLMIHESDVSDILLPTLPHHFKTTLMLYVIFHKKSSQPLVVKLIIDSVISLLKKQLVI